MGILATLLHKTVCIMSFNVILELRQLVYKVSVHTAPFCYKNGEENFRSCESVETDPHKNSIETEVFEKTLSKVDIHKNGSF